MLSCLRDTRTSITGGKAKALHPSNLKANLAEPTRARRSCNPFGCCSPMGVFCLNSGGTSE